MNNKEKSEGVEISLNQENDFNSNVENSLVDKVDENNSFISDFNTSDQNNQHEHDASRSIVKKNEDSIYPRLIPPDGGWGWLVCAGCACISVSIII